MIDLHTHSILSDGCLLPSELVRRAEVNGLEAIAVTDHVDHSNMESVIKGLVRVSEELNKHWDIYVIPGVEITHVPLGSINELVLAAREHGAKIVIGHGESPVEPVIKGTNSYFIQAKVDILAHPGNIHEQDAALAAENGVYLEITARAGHSNTNHHVFETATRLGAQLVINTDSHEPKDLMTKDMVQSILRGLTDSEKIRKEIFINSQNIVNKVKNL